MRKIKIGLINKCRKVINFTFIIISTEIISAVFLLSGCTGRKESGPSSNEIQAYFVKWWGTPGSRRSRPPTGVLNITNDKFTLRYTIQEGRPLGDYRLPYWGVNSFVSIFSEPAEIAHHGSVNLNIDGKKINLPLRIGNEKYRSADVNRIDSLSLLQIGNGFELARFGKADVLKVTCLNVGSPIVVESYFVINNGSLGIPVIVRATNVSDKTIREVEIRISYTQDFNWSSFGKSNAGKYQEIKLLPAG